jgi:hypothetical protein
MSHEGVDTNAFWNRIRHTMNFGNLDLSTRMPLTPKSYASLLGALLFGRAGTIIGTCS